MVYSTLDIFTTIVSTRDRVTHRVKLVVGATEPPADVLAAALTLLSRVQLKVAGCYNYKGNELVQYRVK